MFVMIYLFVLFFFFFFFSSRRRHTRSLCDWSSDVCSSDLHPALDLPGIADLQAQGDAGMSRVEPTERGRERSEEHTSELQSHSDLVCRLLLEKKKIENIERVDDRGEPDDRAEAFELPSRKG